MSPVACTSRNVNNMVAASFHFSACLSPATHTGRGTEARTAVQPYNQRQRDTQTQSPFTSYCALPPNAKKAPTPTRQPRRVGTPGWGRGDPAATAAAAAAAATAAAAAAAATGATKGGGDAGGDEDEAAGAAVAPRRAAAMLAELPSRLRALRVGASEGRVSRRDRAIGTGRSDRYGQSRRQRAGAPERAESQRRRAKIRTELAARTGRVAHAAVARHHCSAPPVRIVRVPPRLLGERRASGGQPKAAGV